MAKLWPSGEIKIQTSVIGVFDRFLTIAKLPKNQYLHDYSRANFDLDLRHFFSYICLASCSFISSNYCFDIYIPDTL
jgi:hypothetical protein